MIKLYQIFISPVLCFIFCIQCRFDESCSNYTKRMILQKGAIKGMWLGIKRFLSCNPWHA